MSFISIFLGLRDFGCRTNFVVVHSGCFRGVSWHITLLLFRVNFGHGSLPIELDQLNKIIQFNLMILFLILFYLS